MGRYNIVAIGNEAQKNLENLGHVAVNFTGDQTPELAGSVYVEAKAYPEIKVGSRIAIG